MTRALYADLTELTRIALPAMSAICIALRPSTAWRPSHSSGEWALAGVIIIIISIIVVIIIDFLTRTAHDALTEAKRYRGNAQKAKRILVPGVLQRLTAWAILPTHCSRGFQRPGFGYRLESAAPRNWLVRAEKATVPDTGRSA